tara:strand:+ start:474 stop:1001 length:528 start_codon:yes stop_codon:yes gene_type:complete
MKKKVLSALDIYSEEVNIPGGFEINRKKIFSHILHNCFIEREIFNYKNTFKVDSSQDLGWFNQYIIEHLLLRHKVALESHNYYGLILYPGEMSIIRNENNLYPTSAYTVIYGIEVPKNSTELTLSFKDKNKLKIYSEEIYDNKFIIFPSSENYFLTRNNSSNLICFLVGNFLKTF